jgi:hypothetical protein
MTFRGTFVATLLLVICIGAGCKKDEKLANIRADQPGPSTSVTDTDTGSSSGTVGNGNPNDPGHHHPLAVTTLKIYQDNTGACYTDQAWLDVTPGTDTVAWSSSGGKSAYQLEFYSTPLRIGTTPAYVVTVPANTSSSTYSVADYKDNCKNLPSATSCYFQYQIVKVPSSSAGQSDVCGPSPLTVGIHIKPIS